MEDRVGVCSKPRTAESKQEKFSDRIVSVSSPGWRPANGAPPPAGRLPLALLTFVLFVPGLLYAQEAGALPLLPGETLPHPRQRGVDEIAEIPEHETACPACGFMVAVPEVDKLMRRDAKTGETPAWRMHHVFRDADLCPYPGPGKAAFQADIVVCPSCGFAASEAAYANTLSPAARKWVADTLRGNLRAAQKQLLGLRASEMSEAEIIAFFNRQAEIPDIIRTEHARIRSLARKEPALVRARATWLAAWAARREIVAPPKGEFLSGRAAALAATLDKTKRERPGPVGDIEAIRFLLGKNRSGKDRLAAGEQMAARVELAGLLTRIGHNAEAEKELVDLLQSCRDRFSRPEQAPLWGATPSRLSRNLRQYELDVIRNECEVEISIRLELMRQQRERLREAAVLIRTALRDGELAGRPAEALFHGYLLGEFLRRSGDLPLASEWFKLVLGLSPGDSAIETAAQLQLVAVREQAGDAVNLLSAIGHDGEAIEILRGICGTVDSAKR